MIEIRFTDGPHKGEVGHRRIATYQEKLPVETAEHGMCEDVYHIKSSGYTVVTYKFVGRRRLVRGESKWVPVGS